MKKIIQAITATIAILAILLSAMPAHAAVTNGVMFRRNIYVKQIDTGSWYWQISPAIWKWSDSPAINLYNHGYCPVGYPCITIRTYNAPDSQYGYSKWWWDERGVTSGIVYLNWRYSSTARQRQAVACHEIGHVIGAIHNSSISCMGKGNAQGPYPYPSTYDYNMIVQKYNYSKIPW